MQHKFSAWHSDLHWKCVRHLRGHYSQHMRHAQLKLICGAAVAEYTVQLCIWLGKQTGRKLCKQYW